jgi:hypothetical protein
MARMINPKYFDASKNGSVTEGLLISYEDFYHGNYTINNVIGQSGQSGISGIPGIPGNLGTSGNSGLPGPHSNSVSEEEKNKKTGKIKNQVVEVPKKTSSKLESTINKIKIGKAKEVSLNTAKAVSKSVLQNSPISTLVRLSKTLLNK